MMMSDLVDEGLRYFEHAGDAGDKQYVAAIRAELDRLRADARRWQTVAPMFQGCSLRMDGTSHWVLPGGAIKPRARTVAEAVDAMAPNAGGKAPAAGAVD
jgi:hypothetical protein